MKSKTKIRTRTRGKNKSKGALVDVGVSDLITGSMGFTGTDSAAVQNSAALEQMATVSSIRKFIRQAAPHDRDMFLDAIKNGLLEKASRLYAVVAQLENEELLGTGASASTDIPSYSTEGSTVYKSVSGKRTRALYPANALVKIEDKGKEKGPAKIKGQITTAGRKRIAEAQKLRWAKVKRAAAKAAREKLGTAVAKSAQAGLNKLAKAKSQAKDKAKAKPAAKKVAKPNSKPVAKRVRPVKPVAKSAAQEDKAS